MKIKRLFKRIIAPLIIIFVAFVIQVSPNDFTKQFFGENSTLLNTILNITMLVAAAWLCLSLIDYGKKVFLLQYNIDTPDNLKARKIMTQFSLIQKIINFIIIVITIALVLLNFEGIRKIGISLLASAGIAGLIIGVAAQKLLSTVIAGLQIAFTQPIRIEDVVIVENEWGWIEEITLTYVVVRIWDKRRLIVPTTYFMEKPFQNWTRNTSEILGSVYIYTDYKAPINALREELQRIVNEDNNWDGQTQVLQVTNATEHALELRVLVSAKSSPEAWNLRVNVREKLVSFLQENYPECLPRTRVAMQEKAE